jgi:hypothetical protein
MLDCDNLTIRVDKELWEYSQPFEAADRNSGRWTARCREINLRR